MTNPVPLIEELFCQGNPLEDILRAGPDNGWTRDDVMAVLRDRQWDLDGSGRLPRSKRLTLPRGLRGLPAAPLAARQAPAPASVRSVPAPRRLEPVQPAAVAQVPVVRQAAHPPVTIAPQAPAEAVPVSAAPPAAAEPPPTPLRPSLTPLVRDDATRGVTVGAGRDLDEWLAAAERSPHAAVRRRAAIALVALLQLRTSLDDLARVERSLA